jgi:hypothetical protein
MPKPKICYHSAKEKIPDMRSLFKAVERPVEMENFCRKPFIHKAFWLCDIDLDVAFAVQKGIFAVDV